MPDLSSHAYDLDGDDQQEDESGAFVTFAPALPVLSVVYADPSDIGVIGIAGHLADLVGEWADADDLSLPADGFVDTLSFAPALPVSSAVHRGGDSVPESSGRHLR